MKPMLELTRASNLAMRADMAIRSGDVLVGNRLYLEAGAIAVAAISSFDSEMPAIQASLMNNAVGYYYKAGEYQQAARLSAQYLTTPHGRLLESRLEEFMVAAVQAKQLSAQLSDSNEYAPFVSTLNPLNIPSGMATPKQVSSINDFTSELIHAVVNNVSVDYLTRAKSRDAISVLSGASHFGSYRQIMWVMAKPTQMEFVSLDGTARTAASLPTSRSLVQLVLKAVSDFTTLEPDLIKQKFPNKKSRQRLTSALTAFNPDKMGVESIQFSDTPTSSQIVINQRAYARVKAIAKAETLQKEGFVVEGILKEAEHQTAGTRFTLKGHLQEDGRLWEHRVHVDHSESEISEAAMAFFIQKTQVRAEIEPRNTISQRRFYLADISTF